MRAMWVLRSCSSIGAEPEAASLIPAETGRLRPPRTGPAGCTGGLPFSWPAAGLPRPEPVGATRHRPGLGALGSCRGRQR